MKLEDDPELIRKYKEIHSKENTWPAVSEGMKAVGILDMELYIAGNRLFMIMDTVSDFDHEKDMQRLAEQPRQEEWEAYVSSFQQTSAEAAADEKWQLMERIYKLDQQQEYRAAEGQLKECP